MVMLDPMSDSHQRVQRAVEALRRGEIIVVSDHEHRENEGDLMYAAQFSTPDKVNFLITHGKGLVCVALEEDRADELNLPPMVQTNRDSFGTAFTVSVDSVTVGTGISAAERSITIKKLADPKALPEDFRRPGHVFPLRAKKGGVLVRPGHTEAMVQLCQLAALEKVGVICEIIKEDGSMARGQDLLDFCQRFSLVYLTVDDLIEVVKGGVHGVQR